MHLTRKTWILLAATLALGALNLADRRRDPSFAQELPSLPALVPEQVTRIEVSTSQTKVALEPQGGTWMVKAPFDAKADQALIASLLRGFDEPTPLDVRVDNGEDDEALKTYGLDASNGIVAELWTGGEQPAISFTIGFDAPGGSSFIRLSGDPAVYRARVGGRGHYDRPPVAWRSPVLLDFDPAQAVAIEVQSDGAPVARLVRGPSPGVDEQGLPQPGPWALDPDPGWEVDQREAEALARALGQMRAGGLLGTGFDGGFDPPRGVVTVTLADGQVRSLVIGRRQAENAAFVRVGEETYQVAGRAAAIFLRPAAEYQDRTIFSFAREEVDTLALEEGAARVLLQQNPSTFAWEVLQPQNVDIDLKLIQAALATLAELRADGVAAVDAAAAGLAAPRSRVTAQLRDGRSLTLEIGAAAGATPTAPVYVRRADEREIYVVSAEKVAKIRQAFGRP